MRLGTGLMARAAATPLCRSGLGVPQTKITASVGTKTPLRQGAPATGLTKDSGSAAIGEEHPWEGIAPVWSSVGLSPPIQSTSIRQPDKEKTDAFHRTSRVDCSPSNEGGRGAVQLLEASPQSAGMRQAATATQRHPTKATD